MELVPLDRFTIGYGLQLLCQGIGTFVGPPYAGTFIRLSIISYLMFDFQVFYSTSPKAGNSHSTKRESG